MTRPKPKTDSETNPPEPRWLIVAATLAAGGLYFALPESLSAGPRWLLFVIVVTLTIPASWTNHKRLPRTNRVLGYLLNSTITLFMLWSLFLLIRGLFNHSESPQVVLRSGALLWLTNVLTFASWYWRLDAGGYHGRAARLGHVRDAFLFPQMTDEDPPVDRQGRPWYPRFIDYLFLAFNTSTAFSPTDTPVFSRWAKVLLMIQSLIALTITLVLVGRAVNIM